MRCAVATRLAIVIAATISCGDSARTIATPGFPLPVAPSVTRLRGTADFAKGTLTFESMAPATASLGAANGIDRAIYGNQGVTVKVYNGPVTIVNPSSPGKKTFSAMVGVKNLETFRIGDEQGVAAPPDTMGIYVFVDAGPTVTGTSSSCPFGPCVVKTLNHHGTLNFNAPGQRYWFWPELLGPTGPPGGFDTTRVRKQWVFEADIQVTSFTFDVLVSAAWVTPNETIWKVDFPGDSLPLTQAEPRWKAVVGGAGGGTATALLDTLRLNIPAAANDIGFVRFDSVLTTTNAFMQATLRLSSGNASATHGQPAFLIDDQTKAIGMAVSTTTAGFTGADETTFLAGAFAVNATQLHTYEIRKYAADSVLLFMDGGRQSKLLYGSLPASVLRKSSFSFGASGGTLGANVSLWGHVIYQIGKSTP